MTRNGALALAAVLGFLALILVAAAGGLSSLIRGEQPTQAYWQCYNYPSVENQAYGPNPHHPALGSEKEGPCLDSQLMAAKFTHDPAAKTTGGWKAPAGYTWSTPFPQSTTPTPRRPSPSPSPTHRRT
jgi:hypothetical protein